MEMESFCSDPVALDRNNADDDDEEDYSVSDDNDDDGGEYDDDDDDDDESDDDEPLYKHARDVYKPEIFDMFRDEYKKLNSLAIDVTDEGFDNEKGLVFKYGVGIISDCYNLQEVIAEPVDEVVECSCKYFEYAGILCSHALLALNCLRIETIPEKYILKRFTKDGKLGTEQEPPTLINRDKQRPMSLPQHLYHIWLLATGNSDTGDYVPNEGMYKNCADVPLLSHAEDVYTVNAYNIFRGEYEKSRSLVVNAFNENSDQEGKVIVFDVHMPGQESRLHMVAAVPFDGIVNCTCKMFQFAGILCSHALSVLRFLWIDKIPDEYILKMFTESDGVSIMEGIHGCKAQENLNSEVNDGDGDVDADDTDDDEEGESEQEDEDEDDDSDDDEDERILRHAMDVYKPEIFDMFQEEYKKLRSLNIDVIGEDFDERGLVFKYKVGKLFDDYDRQEVTAAPMDGIVECSCKYFEFAGVLCSHAILALRCLHIETMPDKYILKRFTKDGKIGTAEEPRFLIEKNKQYLMPAPQYFHHIWMLASVATGNSSRGDFFPYKGLYENCADVPMLRHAMDVYTKNAFNMFQDEYEKSRSLVVDVFNETCTREGLVIMFDVRTCGKYSGFCTVTAVPLDGIVTCTCKKFEFAGFLCSHALSVLHFFRMEKIPDRYILKRFMKDKAQENLKSEAYETMCANLYRLMVQACESDEAYKFVSAELDKLSNRLEKESEMRTGQFVEVPTSNGVPSNHCPPPCDTAQPSADFLKSPQ